MDLIAGDMGLVEIWVWDLVLCSRDWLWGRTQRTRTCSEKIMKGIKKKEKDKKDIQLIYFVLMHLNIKKAQER